MNKQEINITEKINTKNTDIVENIVDKIATYGRIATLGLAISFAGTQIGCNTEQNKEQIKYSAFKTTDLAITQSVDSIYLRKTNTYNSNSYFIGAIAKKDIDTINMSYNSPHVYCDDTVIEFKGITSNLDDLVDAKLRNTNLQMTKRESEGRYKWEKAASEISNELNLPAYKIIHATVYAPRTRK